MLNIIILVIGIALIIAGIVWFVLRGRAAGKRTPLVALAVTGVVVMLLSACFSIIPTGYVGVRYQMGIIDETPVQPGFTAKPPFIQEIKHIDTKYKKVVLAAQQGEGETSSSIAAESNSKAQVFVNNVSVTYRVLPESAAWFEANVVDYENNLVSLDIITSAIKGVLKQTDTEEVTNRTLVEPQVREALQEALAAKYGEGRVEIREVILQDMTLEAKYKEAVEKKNIAEQEQQEQATRNETALAKAEAEKQIAMTEAEAKAEAAKIEAEGVAEANRRIAESLTPEVLQKEYIDAIGEWRPSVIGEQAYPTLPITPAE